MTMDKDEFLKTTFDYFAGGFSLIDHDLSYGAYLQMHIDTAERLLKSICSDCAGLGVTKITAHEIVMHYFANKEK